MPGGRADFDLIAAEARPSPLIEVVVSLLVPRACREYIIGDLCERYTSRWQYLCDAAATLPLVLWSHASHVRRSIAARSGARSRSAASERAAMHSPSRVPLAQPLLINNPTF